jgi:hypothetical protein
MHGLRKTMAADATLAGVNVKGIQTIGGWNPDKMAAYCAEAERVKASARRVQGGPVTHRGRGQRIRTIGRSRRSAHFMRVSQKFPNVSRIRLGNAGHNGKPSLGNCCNH